MADDHAIVRAGFRALIEQAGGYAIAAECSDIDTARDAVIAHRPDLLVLDLSLPGGGLNLLPEIRRISPATRVLVLSMHTGDPYVSEAIRRGAAGYVSKGAAADELVVALADITAGNMYFSSDLAARPTPATGGLGGLSEREQEVFMRIAQGKTPKQLAFELGISVKTAYLHRSSIREKLGIQNDLQLHQMALSHGLLDVPAL